MKIRINSNTFPIEKIKNVFTKRAPLFVLVNKQNETKNSCVVRITFNQPSTLIFAFVVSHSEIWHENNSWKGKLFEDI